MKLKRGTIKKIVEPIMDNLTEIKTADLLVIYPNVKIAEIENEGTKVIIETVRKKLTAIPENMDSEGPEHLFGWSVAGMTQMNKEVNEIYEAEVEVKFKPMPNKVAKTLPNVVNGAVYEWLKLDLFKE